MKSIFFSKSLLVLMVSVLITAVSSNSFAQRGPRALGDSTRFGCKIPNLTADQKIKIESLRVKHIKEVTPFRNEFAEKKAHLKTLESTEKPDKDAINKTIDEMTSLQSKIMKLRVNHRIEVSSILTDEQKVFFNSHRGGKMGMGKGMGKGMKRGMRGNCPNCPNKN
jgi:Spy/CpxP family protein refolding chaperone